jgi:hypothetical protein
MHAAMWLGFPYMSFLCPHMWSGKRTCKPHATLHVVSKTRACGLGQKKGLFRLFNHMHGHHMWYLPHHMWFE